MITPHSVHSEHWGDISRYTNKVFSKGFCHDHLLKWKAEAVTTNLNSFHFKQTINRDGKGEDKILKTEDDLRAWWRLDNGKAFYTRLTSEGLKLHTDFGTTEVGGYLFNYYGGLGMTRKGLDRKLYFGFKNLSSHCHSDTRVRVDENGGVEVGNRTHIVHGNWRAALLTVVNARKPELLEKAFMLGYVERDFEFYLLETQDKEHKTRDWKDITQWFNRVTLTGLYHRNLRETYGLEVEIEPREKKLGDVSALVEYRQNANNTFKAKLNDKLNLTFLLRRIQTRQVAISLGVSSPLNAEFSNRIKVGVELDLFI